MSTIDLTLFVVIFLIFNEIFIRLYRTYVKYRNYQIKGYVWLTKKVNAERMSQIKEKMLLCVCRLSPEKNLEILIEAMKLLENKNIYLYIVGEGRLKGKLEELIEILN